MALFFRLLLSGEEERFALPLPLAEAFERSSSKDSAERTQPFDVVVFALVVVVVVIGIVVVDVAVTEVVVVAVVVVVAALKA